MSVDEDEFLQERLVQCFRIQNAVIQNVNEYSQHISHQLMDIRVSRFVFSQR